MSTAALLQAATEAGLLDDPTREAVLADARRQRRDALELATTRLRLPPEAFYRALAGRRGLPFLDAHELVPDPTALSRLAPRLLQRKAVLPVRREGALFAATSDPDDEATLETLARLVGEPLRPACADPGALQAAVRRLGGEAAAEVAFDAVGFLDDLMREAYLRRASDVHLDPRPDGLSVRLRVDGRLRLYVDRLAPGDAGALLTRVKVLGGLDIAERREPQDGGFTWQLGDEAIDVRVATIPTRQGERATLRLLGVESRQLLLDDLGFGPAQLGRLRGVLAEPHGIVLVTGPTGSGKSTTLYAALREVAAPHLNVMTVEDPVELVLPGVAQVQIDRAGKVTFAGALRSLLRHDPDVLMVGEIRDQETGDVALKAAMTGHLVLSSLHTNDAVGAVGRLIDIGCAPYLVGATLRAALAQRLVRRLCPACRAPRPALAGELARLGGRDGATVFEPGGCPRCLGSGFRGRVALCEALWVDAALADAISRGARREELLATAAGNGLRTLAEEGLGRVLAGDTSLAEALLARA